MPLETDAGHAPANRRDWRPQTIYRGRFRAQIGDAILEPWWSGERVLAYFTQSAEPDEWGTIEVFDEHGGEATAMAPRAVDQLRRSVGAAEAVIDGVLSEQAMLGGEGVSPVMVDVSSPLRKLVEGVSRTGIRSAGPRVRPRDGERGFIAVDLLSVDGQSLLDVPLLERKRLLEATIQTSALVRISPWVRPPARNWFASWRSAGFRGLVMKSANSRYRPGEETTEWMIVEHAPKD